MGQGEVGWVTCRVTYTWWLLWLAIEMHWMVLGGPMLALVARMGLENSRGFSYGSEGDLGSEQVFAG